MRADMSREDKTPEWVRMHPDTDLEYRTLKLGEFLVEMYQYEGHFGARVWDGDASLEPYPFLLPADQKREDDAPFASWEEAEEAILDVLFATLSEASWSLITYLHSKGSTRRMDEFLEMGLP